MELRIDRRVLATALVVALAACSGGEVDSAPGGGATPEGAGPSVTISPTSGPRATAVSVRMAGFDPGASLDIGFGPPASEYEVVDQVAVGVDSTAEATVTIPGWAERGRDYVVVAAVPSGPKAVSSPFRVTAEGNGATVHVVGTLTGEGVECPALRTDGGQLYTLAGETGEYGPGDRVSVRGTVAESSFCMQGTTLNVKTIEGAG